MSVFRLAHHLHFPVRSDVEAKHLQLSIDQLEKTPNDYLRSAQALATLAANSGDVDKCSSTNTSLNSSSSSASNRIPTGKILKTNRSIKQRKPSPKSMAKNEMISSPTIIDDYPSITTATSTCYSNDDVYYNNNNNNNASSLHLQSQANYSNLALYPSSVNYSNPACFPAYPSAMDDEHKSYASLPMYNSMYYDPQQSTDYHLLSSSKMMPSKQADPMMLGKKKPSATPSSAQQQQQPHVKRGPSCETLSLSDMNNKRMRLDPEHQHQHLSPLDYETGPSAEKIDLYAGSNTCYASSNYPAEHPYHHHHHHTSVIVDSQQYFLNGWNGATAF